MVMARRRALFMVMFVVHTIVCLSAREVATNPAEICDDVGDGPPPNF